MLLLIAKKGLTFAQQMKEKLTLRDLKIGQLATIISVEECDARVKLMEMGCVPGSTVELVRKAPLGDPLQISVAGYQLSMRKSEAAHIDVKIIN